MATETPEGVYSLPAGADLSAAQYCGVVINTSGEFVLPTAGEEPHGVLQNLPKQGEMARVRLLGRVTKARAGTGGVTLGAKVSVAATGRFVVSVTATHKRPGIALEAAANGEVFKLYHVANLAPVP